MKQVNGEEREDLKNSYFKCKEEIDNIISDMTLKKWKVLSKANKKGKLVWGRAFTVRRLSVDMGLPYTTTKRCLSLDKATPKSLKLMKEKKISAFKLAMICMTRDNHFQDEMVAEVIKKNLSTYQIKQFKPKKLKDVAAWEERQTVKRESMRKTKAYESFNRWVDRGHVLMLTPGKAMSAEKRKLLVANLKRLHKKIGEYIEKNG